MVWRGLTGDFLDDNPLGVCESLLIDNLACLTWPGEDVRKGLAVFIGELARALSAAADCFAADGSTGKDFLFNFTGPVLARAANASAAFGGGLDARFGGMLYEDWQAVQDVWLVAR